MILKSTDGYRRRLVSLVLQRNHRLVGVLTQRRDVRMLVGPNDITQFDYKQWWKQNGDIIQQLLEGSSNNNSNNNNNNNNGDCEDFFDDDVAVNSSSLSSSSSILLKKRRRRRLIEQVYSSDAIYQDLFIDTPPSRDTLKYSFELIRRYWKIEVTKWGSPVLSMTNPNTVCKEIAIVDDSTGEATRKKSEKIVPDDKVVFIRVPYSVTQRPRISASYFVSFDVLRRWFAFEYKYEGWIDLYLRPKTKLHPPSTKINCSNKDDNGNVHDGNNNSWEVYRHDDRIRVFPPKAICHYVNKINNDGERGDDDSMDMLTIVETIPFFSTILQWFRRVHGRIVFSKCKKTVGQRKTNQ
ncbi:hypothetical protein FRACYDRAFT_242140 [Fragilariopsis cylindrus CCMP1102]|uniref:Uncharacterized protein n=1 Tax=Fragilariopsis cylindrus CCMP1102 TaxID=635003 RepID=A0A1E7F6G5_9STRA|nr:hypothetical protein FRACYDRAFT_242140 [Fragilariopsis cylindrus CCMP1102]|eukprot:OEU13788.1 hypothetical protein FRACYDRAFT_242140 [Fragilariopsis cylindrus CCMP1102]